MSEETWIHELIRQKLDDGTKAFYVLNLERERL